MIKMLEDLSTDGWSGARRTLGGTLSLLSHAIVEEMHRRLDAAGYPEIRPGSGAVFEHVGAEGSTAAAMAARAGITPQAMVQVVDYLEARGYVERVPDPRDRRAKLVRLTERGRAADRVSREILAGMERELAGVVGDSDFGRLRGTLDELLAGVRSWRGAARPRG